MIEPATFRQVLGHYPTGVCVVTSMTEGGLPVGIAVGSFTSVSLDPPLVAFFPDRRSASWGRIRDTGRFCANVLGDHQEALCRRFAASGTDKFSGVGYRLSGLGLPILEGVVAWVDCRIHSVQEAGDHYCAGGRVAGLGATQAARPLLFHKGGYGQFTPVAGAVA